MTQVCQQRHDATINPIHFDSKSGGPGSKGYNVYLWRQENEDRGVLAPLCSCMPFLTARKKLSKANNTPIDETFASCGHIAFARAQTCDWTEKDAKQPGYVYDGKCPKCSGPVVDPDTKPMATSTDHHDNMEDLRKLAAELKGIEYTPLVVTPARVPVFTLNQHLTDDPPWIELMADGTSLANLTWTEDAFFTLNTVERPGHHALDPRLVKGLRWPTP